MADDTTPVLVPVSVPIPPPPAQKSNVFAYLFAVVGMVLAVVVAIVIITVVRPNQDNSDLIATVVGMATPTTAALLALIKSTEAAKAVQEVHVSVNERLSQLLAQTALAERAAGRNEAIPVAAAAAAAAAATIPAVVAAIPLTPPTPPAKK